MTSVSLNISLLDQKSTLHPHVLRHIACVNGFAFEGRGQYRRPYKRFRQADSTEKGWLVLKDSVFVVSVVLAPAGFSLLPHAVLSGFPGFSLCDIPLAILQSDICHDNIQVTK